jgi:hypothetical protein
MSHPAEDIVSGPRRGGCYPMGCRKFLWMLIVVLVALGSGQAEAVLLGLEATGHLARTPRWVGTASGGETPSSFGTVFDPTKDRIPAPGDGAGYFRATQFTMTIQGYRTFVGILQQPPSSPPPSPRH